MVRWLVSIGSVLVLGGLYVASQRAVLLGPEEAHAYALWVDSSAMKAVSAILLLSAAAFSFVPDRDEERTAP